ncbi:hypothetical protein CEE45_10055 [Candidatus Heimdallarchaeota archaeon B3_Heim]|nr:MAG: hypothetical protein CEE45_10055 [Candidatus Heimdallarchaeota archaeon B3_Heim]
MFDIMGTKKTISRNAVTIRGQTLRTFSRLFLMLLIFTHLITWYPMGIQIVGSIGIEALFSGLSRGVLNAGFFFWIFVFISALLFGRVFCGWFCWFGGYLELIEVGMEKTRKNKVPRRVLLHLGALAFVALVMKIYSSLLVTWLKTFPTMFTLQLADIEPWGDNKLGFPSCLPRFYMVQYSSLFLGEELGAVTYARSVHYSKFLEAVVWVKCGW